MDDISHGIRQKKVAAFMAVPDVLKHRKVADYQENWKSGAMVQRLLRTNQDFRWVLFCQSLR